ncbi:MAG: 1,4-alpha-glucan branching protein GlgB [Clostridia bacterium]|nr:1,4-alpha-glucan branching protein GlgB [Clostridia bacterium]
MTQSEKLDLFHRGEDISAYDFFGCHKADGGKYVFRVWAPHAQSVSVVGDFNGWNECASQMSRLSDGESFEAYINAREGDRYKFCITVFGGRKIYKADPYSFCSALPASDASVIYTQEINNPRLPAQVGEQPVNIYEVNLLSWKKHGDGSYYSYKELERTLVPYVVRMGYTHVEFMPVTEYPFDGSWGYQVTGYYCVTARLGTPAEFADLVNAFHRQGIRVILDWVPAHFPKDEFALYEFDGQPLYECPLWDGMEHRGWGTRKFDFGRGGVDSFLLSSAAYFLDKFAIDGLRVDAVAAMLYLDYDRGEGQWTPNKYGDNRNLPAIEFIKKLNSLVKNSFDGAITLAEESTAYYGVTLPIEQGGLGFDYKWNMGWMNDILFYCRQDPLYRHYHHQKITFSMMYSFGERYVLPLSHDEVVHVKGSIVNKMPGEYSDKFANMRALLGFMYAHPGKKLNFMGYEIAQFAEWNFKSGIEYFLKKFEMHRKMTAYVKDINFFYKTCTQLFTIENSWEGFEWLVVDDVINNVLAFNRYDNEGNCLLAVINFSGIDQPNYRFGQHSGRYIKVFNSDDKKYGGRGVQRKRVFETKKTCSHGKEYSLTMDIPKLACLYFIKEK